MKLEEVISISNAIESILELEVDPILVYDLNRVVEELKPFINSYMESAKKVSNDEGLVTDMDKYKELLNKEVELELEKTINITDLPKSVKGSVVFDLMPIVYRDEE